MPSVRIKAQLSIEDMLEAVKQLSLSELERFVRQIIALQAHLRAPSLSGNESQLLLKINSGIPETTQARYDELIAKRRAETLTAEEHAELLDLTDRVEQLDSERIEYLKQLACLRQTSLSELMKDLRIEAPGYA